jgi:hypothetical protein
MVASGSDVLRLSGLSANIGADASFARQAIRKFCGGRGSAWEAPGGAGTVRAGGGAAKRSDF